MNSGPTLNLRTAEDLFKAGKFPEAESLCRKILETNPENPAASYLLGCLASRSGNFQQAADLIGKAVQAEPDNSLYKLDLAGLLLELRRVDEAEKHLTSLVEREPENAMALLLLGHAFAKQGNLAAAQEKWFLHLTLRCRGWMRGNYVPPYHPFNTDRYDFPDYDGERLTYFICATPRCGSTLFGDLLVQSGNLGAPHEYMNMTNHGPTLAKLYGIDPADPDFFRSYIDTVKRKRTSPNGVFGIKTHFNQFEPLIQPPILKTVFPNPKFIQILRRNRVAQAVSFSIASQTLRWNSTQEAQGKPHYDMMKIDTCLTAILDQEARWMKFFQVHRIDYHSVYYEDLVADSPSVCGDVAAFLGVDTDFGFEISGADFEPVSDQRNVDWEERYRTEKSVL